MANQDDGRKQDQIEEHSLPGTNQAGKGPGSREDGDQESRPSEGPEEEQIEEHSLPGTNQAGKGPAAPKRTDE